MGYIGWILLLIIILFAISAGCATLLVLIGTAMRSIADKVAKYMKKTNGSDVPKKAAAKAVAPTEKPAEQPKNTPPRPVSAADISADKRAENTAVVALVVFLIVILIGGIINSAIRTCDFIDKGY